MTDQREALYGAYMDGRSDQSQGIAPRGDEISAKWAAALPSTPQPEGLEALPTFEVAQVVGELQPGRRRHDWCSIHGDIGPMESIDAHARRAHGSSADAIRKARKVLKRAARLAPPPPEPTE